MSRATAAPPTLNVTWDGDNLHVFAPRLHFLTGKPLERLKDGMTVLYLSQLTIFLNDRTTVLRRAPDRFAFSYDIWEERFSVTRLSPHERPVSHLTAGGAESWCLENIAISSFGLGGDHPFWLRFELRVADPREDADVVGDSGINLTRLIEIFSREPRAQQPHWTLEAGPLRLSEVKRVPGRVARNDG